jgi:hypothetical protein
MRASAAASSSGEYGMPTVERYTQVWAKLRWWEYGATTYGTPFPVYIAIISSRQRYRVPVARVTGARKV